MFLFSNSKRKNRRVYYSQGYTNAHNHPKPPNQPIKAWPPQPTKIWRIHPQPMSAYGWLLLDCVF